MGGSVRCHLILGLREEEGGGRGEAANLIPRGGGSRGFGLLCTESATVAVMSSAERSICATEVSLFHFRCHFHFAEGRERVCIPDT